MAKITEFINSNPAWRERTTWTYERIFFALQRRYPNQDIDTLSVDKIFQFLKIGKNNIPRKPHGFNTTMCVLDQYYTYIGRPHLFERVPFQKLTDKKPLDLNEQDIEYIKQTCKNLRDRAIVSVLADTGFRADELASMTLRDAKFDADGVELTCNRSKSQIRTVRGIACQGDLAAWVNAHPLRDNPNAALFCCLDNPRKFLNTRNITELFLILRRRAKILHPEMNHVHAHKLRAWDITRCHRLGMSDLLNMKRHGQHDLKMIQVYTDVDATETNDKFLELNGKKPSTNHMPSPPKSCPKCHMGNPPAQKFCGNCGSPMDALPASPINLPDISPDIIEKVTNQIFLKVISKIAVASDSGLADFSINQRPIIK